MCNGGEQSRINIVDMDKLYKTRLVSHVMEEAGNRRWIKKQAQPRPWWKKNYWTTWCGPTCVVACLAVVAACLVGLTLGNGVVQIPVGLGNCSCIALLHAIPGVKGADQPGTRTTGTYHCPASGTISGPARPTGTGCRKQLPGRGRGG